MADFAPLSADAPPTPQERHRTGSMSMGFGADRAPQQTGASDRTSSVAGDAVNGSRDAAGGGDDDDAAGPPNPKMLVQQQQQQGSPPTSVGLAVAKQVNDVLKSEIGVITLINRLKLSIASSKEFATFLKKRSVLEEDHALGLKKLCRMTQENMRRPDNRQGSFAHAYDEMMFIHERMAENGVQFAMSLHQMHEDLLELAANAERNRKTWKANGLAAEQKVAELDTAMRKSKAKYDFLAEEYERARTGEPRQSGGKVFGAFKPKIGAHGEEDILRKVQGADQVYSGHVQTLLSEKAQLENSTRPEAVGALQDIVQETDAALVLQMQKFAAFSEKLLLSNGLIISPIPGAATDGKPQTRSLRLVVASVDNETDLNEFVTQQHGKIQANLGEIKYERHPVLNRQQSPIVSSQQNPFAQHPPQGFPSQQQPMGQPPPQGQYPSQHTFSLGGRSSTGNFDGGMSPPQGPQGPPMGQQQSFPQPGGPQDAPHSFTQQHNRSFSQGNPMSHPGAPPPQLQQQQQSQPYGRNSVQTGAPYGGGPPQLGALSFQGSQGAPPPTQQQMQQQPPPSAGGSQFQQPNFPPPQMGQHPGPSMPVFGVSLNNLYERDGLAVPLVVYQCVQAVDLYGLGLEGIYRQSGSLNHINRLKSMFDTDSQNPALDFRNPENFFHDVNSVAGLLKQFFRDLPDPLLTAEHHADLIAAAKHDDDTVRRDSLHAIINSLPDPNYATLRALALHLFRIMDNANVNRMTSHNLAVIFGPTLMDSNPSTAIQDAGWQIKVIDTILQNTYQIFDED